MNEIYLENPYLLLLIPLFILCSFKCQRKSSGLYFSNIKILKETKYPISLIDFFKYLGLVSLIFAVSSPISTQSYKSAITDAIPFVLAIDASESMEYDFDDQITKNSKFNISKQVAQEFIDKRADDKIALLFFGDYPYIASTLTYDKSALEKILSHTKVNIAGTTFTTINDAIYLSALRLKDIKANSKAIILISDGVDNQSSIKFKEVENIVLENKINLYSILISENDIDNRLKTLSKSSGGEFYIAKNADDIDKIFNKIDKLKKSKINSKEYLVTNYYFQLPLFLSFLSLLLFLYLKNRRAVS